VNGGWVKDLSFSAGGNVKAFPSSGFGYITTDLSGHYFVANGRFPALWNTAVNWGVPCGPSGQTMAVGQVEVTTENPFIEWGCVPVPAIPPPQVGPRPQFSLVGSAPATITVPGTALSGQYGMPLLYVLCLQFLSERTYFGLTGEGDKRLG
jgi:hypothetical protein